MVKHTSCTIIFLPHHLVQVFLMLLLDVMTFIFKLFEVVTQDGYFVKCKDAFGKMGLFLLKDAKLSFTCLHMELQVMQNWILSSRGEHNNGNFENICVELFEHMYLKYPTQEYLECQLQINATWGWLELFAFLDYMHYCWKNCPIDWQGHYIVIYKDKHLYIPKSCCKSKLMDMALSSWSSWW